MQNRKLYEGLKISTSLYNKNVIFHINPSVRSRMKLFTNITTNKIEVTEFQQFG